MVMIIKADGKKAPFDRHKAINSCKYAGASTSLAKEVIDIVQQKLEDDMTTSQMKRLIYDELERRESHTAAKYNIRRAIADLDPATHQFEHYIAHLFQYFGYETEWSPVPKPMGYCTDHEIDVFLKKGDELSFVECKHHFSYHRFTGLGVPMRVWARLQDLKEGHDNGRKGSYDFKESFIVTNTKFSEHAIRYSSCKKKNINLKGWNSPKREMSLNDMIEKHKAYPLTMLNLDKHTIFRLFELDVHDIKDFDFIDEDIIKRSGLSTDRIRELKSKVSDIIN